MPASFGWALQSRMRINNIKTMKESDPARGQPRKDDSRPISTGELFAGRRSVDIVHQGETYRLRITRNDKLILTK